ncbi:MAG: peptidylprolyl isomerase, partial [Opitutus sp.]
MSFRRFRLLAVSLAAASLVQAQTPSVSQPIGAQTLVTGGPSVSIGLQDHFAVTGVSGPVVQFDTVKGIFNVELRSDVAPKHVENFLKYVETNAYDNSFFHRAASFDAGAISIVQGGGYRSAGGSNAVAIPKLDPVDLEYSEPNARGTLAAARTASLNSANSEWFFNVRDNSTVLGEANSGGYSVFGRVLGNGMTVVDAIAALNRVAAGGVFSELPVQNYTVSDPATPVSDEHLIIVNSISEAALFPAGGGTSIVSFSVQNSAPAVVGHSLSGSTLTLAPLAGGSANLTVRATNTEGTAVET